MSLDRSSCDRAYVNHRATRSIPRSLSKSPALSIESFPGSCLCCARARPMIWVRTRVCVSVAGFAVAFCANESLPSSRGTHLQRCWPDTTTPQTGKRRASGDQQRRWGIGL